MLILKYKIQNIRRGESKSNINEKMGKCMTVQEMGKTAPRFNPAKHHTISVTARFEINH